MANVQAQRGEVDEAAPDRTATRQPMALAGRQRAEQLVQAHHSVPGVGRAGVALEALVERNALPLEPAKPVLADQLAVGQQGGDAARAKHLEEALHQGDALWSIGVARLVQHRPEHGQGDAPVGDAEHQNVEVRLAEPPMGTVHRQPPGAVADPNEAHQQPRQGGLIERESAKETLQALVVELDLGRAAEASGQLGQVDAAHLEQGQKELREKPDPGAVPRQMFGQHRFEFVDGVVDGSLHWSTRKKCLA